MSLMQRAADARNYLDVVHSLIPNIFMGVPEQTEHELVCLLANANNMHAAALDMLKRCSKVHTEQAGRAKATMQYIMDAAIEMREIVNWASTAYPIPETQVRFGIFGAVTKIFNAYHHPALEELLKEVYFALVAEDDEAFTELCQQLREGTADAASREWFNKLMHDPFHLTMDLVASSLATDSMFIDSLVTESPATENSATNDTATNDNAHNIPSTVEEISEAFQQEFIREINETIEQNPVLELDQVSNNTMDCAT